MRKVTEAAKQARGTARPDRKNKTEPGKIAPYRIGLPASLRGDGYAKEFWRRIVHQLNADNILVKIHVVYMEQLAILYAEAKRAYAEAVLEPATVAMANGVIAPHPARKRADELRIRLIDRLEKAGLSPTSTHRLEVPVDTGEERDPLEVMLETMGAN